MATLLSSATSGYRVSCMLVLAVIFLAFLEWLVPVPVCNSMRIANEYKLRVCLCCLRRAVARRFTYWLTNWKQITQIQLWDFEWRLLLLVIVFFSILFLHTSFFFSFPLVVCSLFGLLHLVWCPDSVLHSQSLIRLHLPRKRVSTKRIKAIKRSYSFIHSLTYRRYVRRDYFIVDLVVGASCAY